MEAARTLNAMEAIDRAYAQSIPDSAERRLRVWQSICKSLMGASEFVFVN